jgi:hypothetical protein
MTDRIRHVTITLDKDYRDDDAKVILDAISMIKGVGKVTPRVVEVTDHLARESVRVDLEGKLYKALSDVFRKDKRE